MTRQPLFAFLAAAVVAALLSCTGDSPTGGGDLHAVSFSFAKHALIDPDHYSITITGNGVDIDTTGASGDTVWFSLTPGTYRFGISAFDADDRLCGVASFSHTVTEGSQVITVDLQAVPDVTVDPSAVAVTDGDEAVFSVAADGDSLTYQWQRDDSDIPGATDSSYTIASVSTTDSGAVFRCIVTNPVGSDTSASALLEVLASVPVPHITTEPQDQQATVGDSVVFALAADGPGLSYQWLRDGAVMNGEADSTLRFVATAADSGNLFSCIVSNSAGADTSRDALLEVSDTTQSPPQAPSITADPQDRVAGDGDSVVFTVAADGDSLTYQWQRDESNIAGAEETSYGLTVSTADSGAVFRCIVSNAHGSDTSAGAVLRVFAADSLIDTLLVTATDTLTAVRPFHVTGLIRVESGGLLIINPGVYLKMGQNVYLEVYGELRVLGTAQEPVTITAYDTTAKWGDIWFYDDAIDPTFDPAGDPNGTYQTGCILRYCTIEYADENPAVWFENACAYIDHCIIRRNRGGVAARGPLVSRIEHSRIENNLWGGVAWGDAWAAEGSVVLLADTVRDNGGRGVEIYETDYGLVRRCLIARNLEGGMFISRTDTSTVDSCDIRDNVTDDNGGGINLAYGGPCIIADNTITGNEAYVGGGFYRSGGASGRALILRNLIADNTALNAAAAGFHRPDSIAYNTFHGNTCSTTGDSWTIELSHHVLTDDPETSFMHNTVVEVMATYAVRNMQEEDGRTLNLRENWWGTDVQADIADMVFDFDDDSTYQRTDYSSYLSSPEPLAPAVPVD